MPRLTTGLCFISLLFSAVDTRAQNPQSAHFIQLTSAWSGLPRRPPTTYALIERDKDKEAYWRDGAPVDAAQVQALLNALQAPRLPQPNLDDLGVTPAWLKADAPLVAKKIAGMLINGAQPDLSAIESSFKDPQTMDAIALGLFGSRHTDDDPSVTIAITLSDGSTLSAKTRSQAPFLLPWTVTGGEKPGLAYNADISRAAAALLPEQATNRSRLLGTDLDRQMAQQLAMQISRREHASEVEAQTGNTLSTIRKKYEILSESLMTSREPVASKDEPQETNLNLELKSPDLPPYLHDNVTLRFDNGRVPGTDQFLSEAPRYEKLAASVPWLNQYLQRNATSTLRVYIVDGVSFTNAAFKLFAADMRTIEREDLIAAADRQKGEIALVSIGTGIPSSTWLIFPDGQMLLWRSYTVPTLMKTLLKWATSDIPNQPCSEPGPFVRCVGVVVSPSGNLTAGK